MLRRLDCVLEPTTADVLASYDKIKSKAENLDPTSWPLGRVEVFNQELNDETYAVCRSDMMIKGQDASHIIHGNSFTEDGHQRPASTTCSPIRP